MKLLGILRASGLCLLVSAFHGPRGIFCSNLEIDLSNEPSTVEVSDVSENLEDSTVESQESLPSSQSGLVFQNSKWDDSMLASTVLFIEEFCKDVKAEKFNEHLTHLGFLKIGIACDHLSGLLDFLTKRFPPTYGPGSVAERKEIPGDLYKDALKPEDFDVYAKWIVKNIPGIKGSFKKMLKETKKGSVKKLQTETSRGPLKYGFVLKDCNRWRRFIWFDISELSSGMAFFLERLHSYLSEILQNFEGSNV
ncbi:secreted antigen 1 [Babesia divergens]|uniref:Secreted antigen 1 n=1 Tax=Babesia divergens TaxID=32595 RepID=A0AAD9G7H9_BABDI|nr:secreted antigen 1 [Babesia divergens]